MVGADLNLPVAGLWTFEVTARYGEFDEVVFPVEIPVTGDVVARPFSSSENGRMSSSERHPRDHDHDHDLGRAQGGERHRGRLIVVLL